MIALLVPIVARLGIAQRFQRVAAWLLALVLLAAIVWVAWAQFGRWLDRTVDAGVQADRTAGTLEVRNDQVEAERAAGAAMRNRTDDFTRSQAKLEDAADAALANHSSPLDAVLDGMRPGGAPAHERRRP